MVQRVLVGITGASGSIYAEKLIEELLKKVERVYVVASRSGREVCQHEIGDRRDGFSLLKILNGKGSEEWREKLRVFQEDDFFAPIASGSSSPSHMVIVPCSMGTLARVCGGISSNLLERAADVMLKQKRPLLICPRETPLSAIHLKNMLQLAEMGVHMIPTMPAFYQKPKSLEDIVDFMVGRILEQLDLKHELYKKWNPRMV